MRSKRLLVFLLTAFTVFGFLIIAAPLFAASKEKVLHSFDDNGKDGTNPMAGLIFDAAGNLYGTTSSGGGTGCYGVGCGTVFELTPSVNGRWTEKALHNFNGTDGNSPLADLIFDAAGNLYGTTYYGGPYCGGAGCGTVFRLTPGADGHWRETVLHKFCSTQTCSDGTFPAAGLILDSAGNLYGDTSSGGGSHNGGTVFRLKPGPTASGLRKSCTASAAKTLTRAPFPPSSSMRLGTCMAQLGSVALITTAPSSGWYRSPTASGRRQCCTTSATAKTGPGP
jgi:uncharacterized repeat protein (TIGR03803 family)